MRLSFLQWVERERLVDIQQDPAACQLRVRIMRRGGGRTVRIFSDLLLARSRLAPVDLIAAAFPDPIDRIAIQLQGRDLLPALPPLQGRAGSLGRSDPQAPPAPRSERYSPRIQARPQRPREPTPERPEILAPPSDRVPFYRPR